MRVLLTRMAEDAQRSAAALALLGHEPVLCPLTTFVPLGWSMPSGHFDAVAVTSAHALSGFDGGCLGSTPLYAVGARTAEAARRAGAATVVEGAGTADGLVRQLANALPQGARVLFLAGTMRKPTLETGLQSRAITVTVVETYRLDCPVAGLEAVDFARIDAVLHYSRGAAHRFAEAARGAGVAIAAAKPQHLCLSQDVAEGLASLPPLPILVAAAPDEVSLFSLLAICGS